MNKYYLQDVKDGDITKTYSIIEENGIHWVICESPNSEYGVEYRAYPESHISSKWGLCCVMSEDLDKTIQSAREWSQDFDKTIQSAREWSQDFE